MDRSENEAGEGRGACTCEVVAIYMREGEKQTREGVATLACRSVVCSK